MPEHRNAKRRNFAYYMHLNDDTTKQVLGTLLDVSAKGFRIDSRNPIPAGKDFRFRLDVTNEVADKSFISFVARSRWCKLDPNDPSLYDVGFEIMSISVHDNEIYQRVIERYSSKDSW
jgi:hypothetical protein